MMQRIQIPKLVAMVLACEAAGIAGSFATRDALVSWYPRLRKPSFNPPSPVFGPVWTTLYALMGVSLYLVDEHPGAEPSVRRQARTLFGAQLALNTLWSFLFFGRRSPLAALVEIVLLWGAIVATILAFARISRTAALLLAPYLVWVSFAAVLNFELWRLNR